jgi:hypothetical protein
VALYGRAETDALMAAALKGEMLEGDSSAA